MMEPLFTQGYIVRFVRKKVDLFDHYFCGPLTAVDPTHRDLMKYFIQVMTIDLADARLPNTLPIRKIPLIFPLRSPDSCVDVNYRILDDQGKIELLGEQAYQFDSWHTVIFMRPLKGSHVELVPLTVENERVNHLHNTFWETVADLPSDERHDRYQMMARETHEQTVYEHQIGGIPLLTQGWDCFRNECISCGNAVKFLASIWDYTPGERSFTDSGDYQMIFGICDKCMVISAAITS